MTLHHDSIMEQTSPAQPLTWRYRYLLGIWLVTFMGCDVFPSDPDGQTPLTETTWELISIQTSEGLNLDASVLEEPSVLVLTEEPAERNTAAFAMTGSTGCNQFGGHYTTQSRQRIAFTMGAITLRFCAGPAGEFETAWLAHLEHVEQYELTADRLTLHFEGGSFAFRATSGNTL